MPTASAKSTGGIAIASRITADPRQCGGRPCIRGMRIRVTDVLDLLAAGLSQDAILNEMPDLEAEDIAACIQFASRRVEIRQGSMRGPLAGDRNASEIEELQGAVD